MDGENIILNKRYFMILKYVKPIPLNINKDDIVCLFLGFTAIVLIFLHLICFGLIPKSNDALSKYCPGWCCPDTCNTGLQYEAFFYCKRHRYATNPDYELAKLEMALTDKTIAECQRDTSDIRVFG